MKLFDYNCPEHGVFETWGSASDRQRCPRCGRRSSQAMSAPGIVLKGTDPGFPRAWRRWADAHERAGDGPIAESVRKHGERNHG